MTNIIQFPGQPGSTPKPEAEDEAPTCLGFSGDFYLIGGRDVQFSLRYPLGKIAPKLAAILLRRAADAIEKTPKKP